MKHGIILPAFCILAIQYILLSIACNTAEPQNKIRLQPAPIFSNNHVPVPDLEPRIDGIRSYISKNKFSEKYCFLIDMGLPSGSNRFFVYDLTNDSLIHSGLVTHGRCNERWLEGRRYGNSVGCGCTALGKYKIGHPYFGRFGLAYKLYGLDTTNNNAFERFVVLHSHECVPDGEQEGDICQSDGCPTVSPDYLKVLQKIIDGERKPVLLWIYDESFAAL